MFPAIDFSTSIPQSKAIRKDNFVVNVDVDKITVKIFGAISKNDKAQVYSINGSLMAEKLFQSNLLSFDCSKLTKGNYLIRVFQGQNTYDKKVIIP
jgi:hypothetical protein